jgi:hypothetical protein
MLHPRVWLVVCYGFAVITYLHSVLTQTFSLTSVPTVVKATHAWDYHILII